MSNDGITDELLNFFESLAKIGDLAIEALKEQIDIETDNAEKNLQATTPVNTGGLQGSLTRTLLNEYGKYGHVLKYDGNDPNGVPYEKIANILNKGTSTVKPQKFITKTIRNLKGLDDRAAERFEKLKNNQRNS